MQYVGRFVSSVYNTITPNINPSTLNGAIDVIVVEREVAKEVEVAHPGGTTTTEVQRTTELAASPFHVRFGKLSVLRPGERKVTLHLNDSREPLPFAMKVGENGEAFFVMEIDSSTDEVPEALVTSPIVGPSPSTEERAAVAEPEPLDLGASVLRTGQEPAGLPDGRDPGGSPLGSRDASVPPPPDFLDMEGYKFTHAKQEQALAQGEIFASEMPLARRHGGRGNFGFGERLDRRMPRWKQQLMDVFAARGADEGESEDDAPRAPGTRRASDTSRAPMQPSDTRQRPRLPRSLSDSALLSAHLRYIFETPRGAPSVGEDAREAEAAPAVRDENEDMGALACAPSDPYVYRLEMGHDTVYSFELSLCNTEQFASGDAAHCAFLFDGAPVSFQRFLEDASIIDDPRLVIRHGHTYHTWESDADMLQTLALYRAALLGGGDAPAPRDRAAPPRGAWRRWWAGSTAGERRPAKAASIAAMPVRSAARDREPGAGQSAPDAAGPAGAPVSPGQSPRPTETLPPHTYVKTLRLSSEQLRELHLRKGANELTFSVTSSYSGVATCRARVFLWDAACPIVVSDIDGTITKSDALGHVFTLMGRDWTHLGVAKLYHDICKNGYRIMYLTSRAIGQADITRDYLKNINQNSYCLPDGPVIMSPDRLIASLHREVIQRKPEVFKMACLRDIARLFGADPRHDGTTPFYAGFGNRITDALSYRSVNIPSSRIFTIDANGEVKMELLELAGYKSSYPNMTDLVDQMFPPPTASVPRDAKSAAFTDFNYWRDDVLPVDLPPDDQLVSVVQPTSPALRALRSPRRAVSSEPSSPPSLPRALSPTSDTEPTRPSRFSRFGLGSLRLSSRRDAARDKGPPATTPAPDWDASAYALSPADRERSLSPSILSDGVLDSVSEDRRRGDAHDADDDDGLDDGPADLDDMYDGRLSAAAARRLRRRRRQRSETSSPNMGASSPSDSPPDPEDDPLLAAGDIQFEWMA
ncbi:phosphatidate phosphatase [Malassezia sp. CBS 17886]|nr:phosphatidate phosphatase [Malassezia sp. CBS 17886]